MLGCVVQAHTFSIWRPYQVKVGGCNVHLLSQQSHSDLSTHSGRSAPLKGTTGVVNGSSGPPKGTTNKQPIIPQQVRGPIPFSSVWDNL